MRAARLTFVLLFAASIVSAQSLTVVSKVTNSDGTSETTTSYVAPDHMRWATGEGEVIVDAKNAQFITLDNRKKTYYVTTKQDIDAMAAKIQEQMNSPEMKRAQEAMKNLPPEQRKRMESMMGSAMDVETKDLGTSRTVAGYKCEDWQMTMGQFSTTEECISNDLKFPPQAWEAYRNFAASMKAMMGAMGPMAKNIDQMTEKMKKMKGFPLWQRTTVSVMGHHTVTTHEVMSIKTGAIPASAFDIPAGYTKIDNPMAKALARGR